MMVSIGVLFVSTVSVSLYAVPKVLYHRGILAQPRRVDPNTQVTMANEGHPGASAVGGDMAAEEMADLRSELSEMRNTNQELREAKMELQVELRQYRADDRVRERDLNQLLLLSSVSPWSCASPVAISSRADPAVMSSGGATADGSSGHAYGMFNTTYGRAERLNPCILCCRPRQEKFSFSISCFTLFLLLLFMWMYTAFKSTL